MTYELHCGDCLEYMATMPDNSVDLIATDGPYHRVKMNEAWDTRHKTANDFIAWLDTVLAQFQRILKPNGSLYMFASPRMAARVEMAIGERFNVLSQIVWAKHDGSGYGTGGHSKVCKEQLRSYFPQTERIIFAEHYGADNIAKGEAGYAAKCDELRGFVFEPLRAYLDGERERAGVSKGDINEALGFRRMGGMAGRHYFSQSQWCLPTDEHYHKMRNCLSRLNHGGAYLQRPYEELRTEYEELRTEYEELRTEYEELRRTFNVSADVHYTDVWTYPTVQAYKGKHPCEKPEQMFVDILNASSRPGAVVFDPFMGSGTTGVACATVGERHFIGCDLDSKWVDRTRQRIEAVHAQPTLFEVAA